MRYSYLVYWALTCSSRWAAAARSGWSWATTVPAIRRTASMLSVANHARGAVLFMGSLAGEGRNDLGIATGAGERKQEAGARRRDSATAAAARSVSQRSCFVDQTP